MTNDTQLIDVQWRRGMMDFAGVHGPSGYVPFDLHKRVLPTWRMNLVPAKAVPLAAMVKAASSCTEGQVKQMYSITDHALASIIKLANSPEPLDLCRIMFPESDMWIALSMPVRLCVSDAHFPEPMPANIQLVHVLFVRPNLIMLDLFAGSHRYPFTETWSSESFDVHHCPVLDRAGAGRLVAAIGQHIHDGSVSTTYSTFDPTGS